MSPIGATEYEQMHAYIPLPNNDGFAKILSLLDEKLERKSHGQYFRKSKCMGKRAYN